MIIFYSEEIVSSVKLHRLREIVDVSADVDGRRVLRARGIVVIPDRADPLDGVR